MNAREYVDQGLAVLPLEPGGKAPLGRLVRRGLHDATRDLATVEKWWRGEPEANVGIRTGEGLAVLDVDPRNGGVETLDAYLQNTGKSLPTTPEVATGGTGWHHYFKAPTGLRSCQLGNGLELKAGGAYVVAPPSLHESGRRYTWPPGRGLGEVPLAKLPDWLARSTPRAKEARPRRRASGGAAARASAGRRAVGQRAGGRKRAEARTTRQARRPSVRRFGQGPWTMLADSPPGLAPADCDRAPWRKCEPNDARCGPSSHPGGTA